MRILTLVHGFSALSHRLYVALHEAAPATRELGLLRVGQRSKFDLHGSAPASFLAAAANPV